MSSIQRGWTPRPMHSMQIVQGIQQRKINRNSGALNMKTPQVKPEWNTGIYIGDGVVATPKPMFEWTDQEIRDYFDQNPNLTMLTYSGMLGLSVGELKEILMS